MYKILIAEDESEMRNLLAKYIKQSEPELVVVGCAENGEEALRITEECCPDIVITDIFMPVMDGLEFLKRTAEKEINLKTIIISGYDEFEYARKAIDLGVSHYLLKPFDPMELQSVLDKIKKELDKQRMLITNMQFLREQASGKENLLMERTLREIISGKNQNKKPDSWILDTEKKYYCVCLLKIPLYLASGGWKLDEQENIDELVKILSNGYLHRDISIRGLGFEKNGAILILSGDALESRQFLYKVNDGMKHLQESLEKYYHVNLVCVIGGVYTSWEGISASYQETLSIWKSLFTQEKSIIVFGEEKNKELSRDTVDSSQKINRLKEQIRVTVHMGQGEEYLEYLDELVQIYASLSPKKTDFIGISAEELVYAVFDEIEQEGVNLQTDRTNEEVLRHTKEGIRGGSLLKIRELLRGYLQKCHEAFVKNSDKNQTEAIVENMKYLIESNLKYEEMNLEWLADKMHFSPAYVRKVFKQKTGERVMEYVIRKRMEKAARLLLKTDMKIQDIAEECGYSNQRYFASSFKKYYDCTPRDFKRVMTKMEKTD